jgi:hypothetical protein
LFRTLGENGMVVLNATINQMGLSGLMHKKSRDEYLAEGILGHLVVTKGLNPKH